MLVEFDKSFSKAVGKINNLQVLKRVEKAIINCETALDISEIKSLKK